MSAALYVRTLDGVLLRFERASQARDWLARGRLTLSDQFMASDGRWRPFLDLIDLDQAITTASAAAQHSELSGAVEVPSDEGGREIAPDIQRAPAWATTTDELLPVIQAPIPDSPSSAAAGPVAQQSAPGATPAGEPPEEAVAHAVSGSTDPSGQEGPVAWALPEGTPEASRSMSGQDRAGADGLVGDGPTRVGAEEDGILTVRPGGETRGPVADADARPVSRGRHGLKFLGIVILSLLAGYAAWHWSDMAKPERPVRIPDPLAGNGAPKEASPGTAEAVAQPTAPEGREAEVADMRPEAAQSPKAPQEVAPAAERPAELPPVDSAPENRPVEAAAAPAVVAETATRRPEPAPAKAPAQVQPAAERPAPVVREAPAPRERPAPAQPPAPRQAPEPRAFAGMTFDQHMEQGNRLRTSDPERAMTHFSAAAALKPGQVAPVAALGDCAARLDKRDQAQRYYARALRIRDSYGPALIGMARLHKQAGDTGTALGFYRRYLEVNSRGSQAGEARAFVEAHGAP